MRLNCVAGEDDFSIASVLNPIETNEISVDFNSELSPAFQRALYDYLAILGLDNRLGHAVNQIVNKNFNDSKLDVLSHIKKFLK